MLNNISVTELKSDLDVLYYAAMKIKSILEKCFHPSMFMKNVDKTKCSIP